MIHIQSTISTKLPNQLDLVLLLSLCLDDLESNIVTLGLGLGLEYVRQRRGFRNSRTVRDGSRSLGIGLAASIELLGESTTIKGGRVGVDRVGYDFQLTSSFRLRGIDREGQEHLDKLVDCQVS